MKSKKSIIVLIIVIILVIIVGGSILLGSKNTEEVLFDFDIEQVEKIELQNGDTGKLMTLTDKNNTSEIIRFLNKFTYNDSEKKEPADGWFFSVTVYEKDGNESPRIYILNTGKSIEIENYIYSSSTSDYFNEFIEKWLP